MKCPACATTLKRKLVKRQSVELDQCPGCRGVWFDAGELRTVLETLGSPQKTLPPDARRSDDRSCPRCLMPLYAFLYPDTTVEVDNCKSCGGTWLDHQELNAIRAERQALEAETPTAEATGRHPLVAWLSRLR